MLKDGSDSVGALGALNRVYLNIGLFSEEWLLHFNPVDRRQADHADRDRDARRRTPATGRRPRPGRRTRRWFFLQAAKPDRLKDAPGGARIPDDGRGGAGSRQDGVRRDLRALPFQQGAEAGRRARSRRLRRARLSAVLEQLLGVDQDGRLQEADARHRQRARLPRRQLPVHRGARAGDAAADQRVQPAGDQCAGRQHLGQLLVAVLQDAAVGRHDHGARSVHRQAAAVQDAGGRTRLHAAAVADQPVVDRAVPAQQHRGRDRSSRIPSVDARMRVFQASIEQMLWPEKRKHDPVLGDKIPATDLRSIAPPSAATSACPADYVPELLRPLSARLHRLLPSLFGADGGITIGPFPKGLPVNLLVQSAADVGERAIRSNDCATRSGLLQLLVDLKLYLLSLPANATDEQMVRGIGNDGIGAAGAEQVPGLRGQSRPLLRHRHGRGRARAQRQRQARADRVPEDVLAVLSAIGATATTSIVGSGAGGGTLAARLAEAGMRVVVLEAGGDARDGAGLPEDYDVPAFHPLASEHPAMRWDFFVQHYADAGTPASRPQAAAARASSIRAPARSAAAPRTMR